MFIVLCIISLGAVRLISSFQIRVNALVKRGSLHMQHERVDDSLRDFDKAALLDPSNCDVFHHRGQVCLKNLKV